MKIIGTPLAIVLLLTAAACSRQPGASAQGGPDEGAVVAEGKGRHAVPHDPRAMTAIDVATGDLSGLANYAGGREDAPPADRSAAADRAVLAIAPAQAIEGSVAADQAGAPLTPDAPATTENSAADGDRATVPGDPGAATAPAAP